MIRTADDVYGDAVNIAARMLALAKPGEAVASSQLVAALPTEHRHRLALVGSRAIKGKQEPMTVYSMVLDEGPPTQYLDEGAPRTHAAPVSMMPTVAVELCYGGRTTVVRDGQRCVIGRAERCDLQVVDPRVSREHAWVQVAGGRATLVDRSTAGSWILPATGSHATLRRESSPLDGLGTIRLGRHPRDEREAPEIEFHVRVFF